MTVWHYVVLALFALSLYHGLDTAFLRRDVNKLNGRVDELTSVCIGQDKDLGRLATVSLRAFESMLERIQRLEGPVE